MGRILFVIFVLSLSLSSFAKTDSTYIGFYSDELSVNTFLSRDIYNLMQELENGQEIAYLPNNPVNIGLGLSINNTVVSFGYGYGFDFLRDKSQGKTESFDFQLHNYGRKFVFDIFIQKYKGFYATRDNRHDEYELCPDLKMTQYGAYGQYVFNHKRYSYKAAFNQNERQLKSAGSVIAGFGAYVNKIRSDSSFVYKDKNNLDNFQFGISAGYAYTWVINPKWYIAGSATTGIHFGSEKINTFGKKKIEVYPTVFPRIAAGYSNKDWSFGFFFVGNLISPYMEDKSSISLFSGNFQLRATKRFSTMPLSQKNKQTILRYLDF